jgi:hypothetical protein
MKPSTPRTRVPGGSCTTRFGLFIHSSRYPAVRVNKTQETSPMMLVPIVVGENVVRYPTQLGKPCPLARPPI